MFFQTRRGLKLYEIALFALLPLLPFALGEDVLCSASNRTMMQSYEYSCLISGDDNVTLYYTYSTGESIKIGIEAVCDGYIGLGWTATSGYMVGSEAVIGIDGVSIKTYTLTSKSSSGIDEGATWQITNATIMKTGDVLFVEWTRPLSSGEDINGNMLWSLSKTEAQLSYHDARGTFDITFKDDTDTPTRSPSFSSTESPTGAPSVPPTTDTPTSTFTPTAPPTVWTDTYERLVTKDKGLVPMCGEVSFPLEEGTYENPDECKQKCDSKDDGCNVIFFYASSGSSPVCGGKACPDCFYTEDTDGEITYSDGCELGSDGGTGYDIFTKGTAPPPPPVTESPTITPSASPTSSAPTDAPATMTPTLPSVSPTVAPSLFPTSGPTSASPTVTPTGMPTRTPITESPTSESPTTGSPTTQPPTTESPTASPTPPPSAESPGSTPPPTEDGALQVRGLAIVCSFVASMIVLNMP